MPYDLRLPKRLKRAGLEPEVVHGWDTRGSSSFNPKGHVNHHTAGGRNGAQPSLNICINGRSDLPGPLCNIFLPREESRRVIVVAAGRANHAGSGGWGGLSGNSSVYGVECEHVGTAAEPLSALRYDNMVRIAAAVAHDQFGANMVCQHREWAPRRKPDFTAAHIPDGNRFRNDVQAMMNAITSPAPKPPKEEDMLALIVCDTNRSNELPEEMRDAASKGAWFFTDGKEFWWCPTRGHAELQFHLGLCKTKEPITVSPAFLKELRPRTAADMNPGETLLKENETEGPWRFFTADGRQHSNLLD